MRWQILGYVVSTTTLSNIILFEFFFCTLNAYKYLHMCSFYFQLIIKTQNS